MRLNICLLLLAMLFSPSLFAQEVMKKNAERQAALMATAYAKGDYLTMARFTHKKVVDMLGGPEKMASALKEKMAELAAKNVKLVSAETGEVMQMVHTATSEQCIIPQYVRMATPENKVYSRTHLLGISTDKGKTWHFLDANGQTPEMINGLVPDLSEELIIPKKEMKIDDADQTPASKKTG
ncbi:MAG: hypothetical protein INR69_02990 [Mucilaginibacter polytrichastri]|nr:hypothetical protein [Mucilaginibacter polytrichastri]